MVALIKIAVQLLADVSVTNHPTADWTLRQLREVIGFDDTHRYLIHDRDSIFARHTPSGSSRSNCTAPRRAGSS